MNLVADLLCLLACLTLVTCDRVYVHPFNLFSFNESDCEKLEKLVQEGKTVVPVSIESQTTPEYEGGMNDNELEAPSLSTWGEKERSYLSDLVYVLGMRFYSALQEAQRGQNVLLSPTSLYSSLVSFYLGASNQTALDLQSLLGFVPPSGNPDCTSTAVGSNFLSSLRTIERLVKSGDKELLFSKTLSLFCAPGIALFQLFMEHLLPSADAFYARAVDFANPGEAVKQINAFVEAKGSTAPLGNRLGKDSRTQTLLLGRNKVRPANVKQAFLLKEPQEFWVDSDTKALVPMLSITGTFRYQTDASGAFSAVEVPLSRTALLVLLQPVGGSDLEHLESQESLQTSAWLQHLAPREIKLKLPALTLEDSSDLQELLADMKMPALLGKGADFSKISNDSLTVGKVINKAFFKLASDGTDQPEDPAAQKEDGVYLDVTLNKPFLFAVFEKQSRAMLFLGRVVNPLHED
uniref:Angiotensinogen n=1 Tax=Junco hyemalis TaxID=40217 RepID=A0A8C5IUE6_JUNHY